MPFIEIAGKAIRLNNGTLVGSDVTCNLAIAHATISPKHARFFSQGSDWFVEDLLSASGTLVNGKPLAGSTKLSEGDTISLGTVPARFSLSDPVAKTASAVRSPVNADANALVGQEIAGFLVSAWDRQETTATVYRAKHTISEKDVLFWLMNPEIVQNESGDFLGSFRDAVARLASVEHPNLLRVYQSGSHRGQVWYVTDVPIGQNLEQFIKKGVDAQTAVDMTLALCRHLALFHRAGLAHGEVRPSLVHVDATGQIRLGSLGLAGIGPVNRRRLLAAGISQQMAYLDPEQAHSGECNVKSDIYSVGCIMVHLLTGKPPFVGENNEAVLKAHAEDPVPRLAAKLNMPMKLDGILQGMLSKSSISRYDDFLPAIEALTDLYTPETVTPVAKTVVEVQKEKKNPVMVYAAVAAIAVCLLGFLIFGRSGRQLRDISTMPFIELRQLSEADFPVISGNRATIIDQHGLSPRGTACRITTQQGPALLLSAGEPGVGSKVYALPAGDVYLTGKDPLKYFPKELLKGDNTPENVAKTPLFIHVPTATAEDLGKRVAQAAAAVIERQQREAEAKLAKQQAEEQAKLRVEQGQKDAELRKLEEQKAAIEKLAQQAKQEAERKEAEQVAKSRVIAESLAERATKLEEEGRKDGVVMDKFTVSKEYAEARKESLREIDELTAFVDGNPQCASNITGHADYKRYAQAARNIKDLCQASTAKLEKFRERNAANPVGVGWEPPAPITSGPGTSGNNEALQKQATTLRAQIVTRQNALAVWMQNNPPTQSATRTLGFSARDQHIKEYNAETERMRAQLSAIERKLLFGGQ